MPEMKTLNGYEIVDAKAREDIEVIKGHNHDDLYDPKGAAAQVKNDLLNGAGGAYDTLKELGDLIDDNVDAIEALETVATGKADKEHTHPEYATEAYVDNAIDNIPGVDLSKHALKSELPTKVSQLENDSNFITREEVPETDLSEYAKKSEIPDVSDFITNIPDEYITESELEAKGYLTEHQSLAAYATKTFVENTVAENQPNLTAYAKKSDIPDVSEFLTSVPGEYITESELNAKGYATKRYVDEAIINIDIPEGSEGISLDNYYTKEETYSREEIENLLGMGDGAPEYLTEEDVNSLLDQKKYLTISAAEQGYFTKANGEQLQTDLETLEATVGTLSTSTKTLYRHNINIHDGTSWPGVCIAIIDTNSAKYTFNTLWEYVRANYYVGVCGLDQTNHGASNSPASAIYTHISAVGSGDTKALELSGLRTSVGSSTSAYITTSLDSTIKLSEIVVAIN